MAAVTRAGRSIWRSAPPPPSVVGAGAAPLPDFAAALRSIGAADRMERKPWVLLGDVRQDLEAKLGLAPDDLVICLTRWFARSSGTAVCAGMAHVSGNTYFAPALNFGPLSSMLPEQALLANLYSHGEIGLDAIVSDHPPAPSATELLRQVKTFPRMRWINATNVPELPATNQDAEQRELGTMIRPARQGLLKKYPLISEVASNQAAECGEPGNCLQHPGFKYLDLDGTCLEEYHDSLARNSAKRSYCPTSEMLAGCSVLTNENSLFAGFAVGTHSGAGALTPLQGALVSLGANGVAPEGAIRVKWTAAPGAPADIVALALEADRVLLHAVAPEATLEVIEM